MKEVKILSRNKVYNGFFGVDELEFQFGDNPERVKRSMVATRFACGILLHNIDKNTLVFSKQYRMGAIDHENPYVIEMPAGIRDNNEDVETCARREVMEETGYGLLSLEKIGSFYASPGYTNEKIDLLYGKTASHLKHAQGGGMADEHEYIQILEIPYHEAINMFDSGEICDGKTAIALLWLARRLG
jgi:nudix-type nucleoside diphosphatase (YffH/AdpP family)